MKLRSQFVVLVAAVVVFAAVAGTFLFRQAGDRAEAEQVAERFATSNPEPVASESTIAVTVIGDDMSSPAQSGTPVPQWPALVQQDLQRRVVSLSTSGSGYTTRPLTSLFGGTFRARAKQVAPSSRVVLFVGGSNDQRATRVQLLRAASDAISSAQRRAPDATVVVIAPTSPQSAAPASLLAVRDALREAAIRGGARFVDPIGQAWLMGRSGYIAEDGRSLTAEGQQALAARIEAVVRPLL